MNVGMMSTWGQHCGIFGYTEQLVESLNGAGHEVFTFGNYPYGRRTGAVADAECFGTGFHPNIDGETQKMDVQQISSLLSIRDIKVFHLQYQDYLYPDKEGLNTLLDVLRIKGIKVVVTQHDSCISPNVDWNKFDIIIRHKSEFKRVGNNVTMPIGIPEIDYKPLPRNKVLSSFGMGRNDNEICQKVCDRVGWTFRFHNSQDKWIPIKGLMEWLQEGDAIALIYPPVGAEVSSSALRIALGTGRPVIVSDTNWFKDTFGEDSDDAMANVVDLSWDKRETFLEIMLLEDMSDIDAIYADGLKELQEKYGWNKIVKYYEQIYRC